MPVDLTVLILLFTLCGPILTSSLPPSPSLNILNNTSPFISIPKNSSLMQVSPPSPSTNPSHTHNTGFISFRPPDPFEVKLRWDGPGFIIVLFYGYGSHIHSAYSRSCTTQAARDALDNHLSEWNQAIGASELQFESHDAVEGTLVLFSVLLSAAMTWNMIFHTVLVVQRFLRDYESMALYFEVEVTGVLGLAAKGNLTAF